MTLRLSKKLRSTLLGGSDNEMSWREIFTGETNTGYLTLYEDAYVSITATATGTLVTISTSSGSTISFGSAQGGSILKKTSEVWNGTASATGTAQWFRFYQLSTDANGDTGEQRVRFDGSVGTTSAYDLQMTNTYIVNAATTTIDTFKVKIPADNS